MAKEIEIQRLRSLQERAQDHQAERDALRAKRNQEQTEREWRRKEKEEASKKAAVAGEMKKAREYQIQHKLHFQAIQGFFKFPILFDSIVASKEIFEIITTFSLLQHKVRWF